MGRIRATCQLTYDSPHFFRDIRSQKILSNGRFSQRDFNPWNFCLVTHCPLMLVLYAFSQTLYAQAQWSISARRLNAAKFLRRCSKPYSKRAYTITIAEISKMARLRMAFIYQTLSGHTLHGWGREGCRETSYKSSIITKDFFNV